MLTETEIAASEFKAKCLQILDEVAASHTSVIVTKHGKPVARLVPIDAQRPPLSDLWKGAQIHGDLLDFDLSDDWEANQL